MKKTTASVETLPKWAELFLDLCPNAKRLQTAKDAQRWIESASKVLGVTVSESDMSMAVCSLPAACVSYNPGLMELCGILRNKYLLSGKVTNKG